MPLKPFDAWPRGVTKDEADQADERCAAAQFPGVEFNFSQNIEDNVEEAASGVKGENSIKLYGNDLETLEKTADKIKDVMGTVPGITDLAVFKSLGQPTVRIDIDRAARRALRACPGRHQRDGAGGHRRPGGRRPLSRTAATATFPIDRAPGAGIPPKPRRHPAHHHRGAQPERQRHRPDPAGATWPTSAWSRAPPSSTAKSSSATFRSNSACAAAIWAAPCSRRSARWPSRCNCPAATASNGSANSAICRRRCSGWRWSCRSHRC